MRRTDQGWVVKEKGETELVRCKEGGLRGRDGVRWYKRTEQDQIGCEVNLVCLEVSTGVCWLTRVTEDAQGCLLVIGCQPKGNHGWQRGCGCPAHHCDVTNVADSECPAHHHDMAKRVKLSSCRITKKDNMCHTIISIMGAHK